MTQDTTATPTRGTYAYDVDFLKQHTHQVLELIRGDARVLLSADYQGRVMTSTATGTNGTSYGWLNYDLMASGARSAQFNPVGGEERFWLGPEGGQYSVYFAEGAPYDMAHWQVPGLIETVAYEVVEADDRHAVFTKTAQLTNHSGTRFDLAIRRAVTLLSRQELGQRLGVALPDGVATVGYETDNRLTNAGPTAWTEEEGLLSIWLLGMLTPSPQTKVIVPFRPRPDAAAHITDTYFGTIPDDRLQRLDSVLVLTCDGRFRSKIGMTPVLSKGVAGSYDFARNLLTCIFFPVEENGLYVKSTWEHHDHPYRGDVVNAYNDGPLADGSQLGPFYELESSSAVRPLLPGETQTYRQVTCHFQGEYAALRQLAQQLLGVDLEQVK
ncbi:hypothetical protein SAMN05421823_101247 [Catalinimonas alkaloidigena]|uniref:Methane oxygenase PmoA n=2 Tax=Catalinimonas alkaloidigena TaxID=1075417 RepID=A0A1G8X2R5_9BACT|nr:hypothetical protein SAMN05421823_101247 [Catalinimonas alkaloidigena]